MQNFFFYDLETSSIKVSEARVMQFAGRRTDLNFHPIGEPINFLVKLSDDILPEPKAIMTTHITPQQTVREGVSEPEMCRIFIEEIATPGTIFVGYNNIRFDNMIMQHNLWRNFRDPYNWMWDNGRSYWDLLDVARFVRALRPEGINWPVNQRQNSQGETKKVLSLKLEHLAKANGFENKNAHDALADVDALINLAKLLHNKKPKMWDFMFKHRSKASVKQVILPQGKPTPFVYASGRYSVDHLSTSVATVIGEGPTPGSYLVWDLRNSVLDFVNMTDHELTSILEANYQTRQQDGFRSLPIKKMFINRCPAVAPLSVLDKKANQRIDIDLDSIKQHFMECQKNQDFLARVVNIFNARYDENNRVISDVENSLYEGGFMSNKDSTTCRLVAAADSEQLASLEPDFEDHRLDELYLRYRARSFPATLRDDERQRYEQYRTTKLEATLPHYIDELTSLAAAGSDDFILDELKLWAESIMPVDY